MTKKQMPKPRHLRPPPPPQESSHRRSTRTSKTTKRHRIITTILIFIVLPVISAYLYRTLFASYYDTSLPYVYKQGLVKKDITYQEIINENAKVSEDMSSRRFRNPVLAYVTPWNSKGYDLAKEFNSKITHISPVWYDLKSQGIEFVLEGRHNVDKGWILDLRMEGQALILPRIVLEAIPLDFLKKKKERAKVIDLIIAECKEMDFDGIVLESWSRWAAYGILHDAKMRNLALQFIKKLGQEMHSVVVKRSGRNLQLVYVIGPPRTDRLQEYDFGPEDFRSLSNSVDGYSLMTYDFSNPQNPGPNAPLVWIHSTMKLLLGTHAADSQNLTQKVFLGINFYGNDYALQGGTGGGAILGRDYLSLLEKHKPQLKWEKKSGEHFFFYTDENQHVVFYPSLLSIAMRLDEARSWGAGISIWEIGQELMTVNGFKAAYAIKDGAEGPRGWTNSGLPWIEPKKSFAFDFSSLTDAFDGVLGEGSDAVSVIFGIAAATGLSLLAFTEVETILEVLGSAALVQIFTKKLLFAEDRKKTLKEVSEFVSSRIGPSDLLDDIKDIGKALLPPINSKTLPAPVTATEEAVVEPTNSAPPEVQATPEVQAPPEVQASVEVQANAATPVEPPPQVNEVPKVEAKEEALPKPTRPLSPYPYYPNFKPPSSPTPSRP